jgi:hypothetical protein
MFDKGRLDTLKQKQRPIDKEREIKLIQTEYLIVQELTSLEK